MYEPVAAVVVEVDDVPHSLDCLQTRCRRSGCVGRKLWVVSCEDRLREFADSVEDAPSPLLLFATEVFADQPFIPAIE
jgi:hypothetical protein